MVLGGVLVLIAQIVTHLFTSRRERRTELGERIDRAVGAFVAGDRMLNRLIGAVELSAPQEVVQGYADAVEDIEVDMRSAVFSVGIRADEMLVVFFRQTMHRFTDTYMALFPPIAERNPEGASEARRLYEQSWRLALDRTITYARNTLRKGPRRALRAVGLYDPLTDGPDFDLFDLPEEESVPAEEDEDIKGEKA